MNHPLTNEKLHEVLDNPIPVDAKHKTGVYSEMGRDLWMAIRQNYLGMVDVIERHLGITPKTANLRKLYKERHDTDRTEGPGN